MRYFIILVYSDYYVSMYYSLKERVKNEVRRPLDSSFFTRSWVLDDGAALCDAGGAILQCIIRYFLTFLHFSGHLVSIWQASYCNILNLAYHSIYLFAYITTLRYLI